MRKSGSYFHPSQIRGKALYFDRNGVICEQILVVCFGRNDEVGRHNNYKEELVMNGKIMALVVGSLLCGLTVFGGYEKLYESHNADVYDVGNGNFTSFGDNICVYNVRVSWCADTNTSHGTAVIFYNSDYGTMKILKLNPLTSVGLPSLTCFEARWTGSSGTFRDLYCEGAFQVYASDLSWEPIYPVPTFGEQQALNDGLAAGGESAPVWTLGADEDISIPKGAYRFTAGVSGSPYDFVFNVYSDVILDYFPQVTGYNGCSSRALAMTVDVYNFGMYVATTVGIFYGVQVSSYQFRTYFTVFPNEAFPCSFSILANYFSVRSQNSLSVFTGSEDSEIIVQFQGN